MSLHPHRNTSLLLNTRVLASWITQPDPEQALPFILIDAFLFSRDKTTQLSWGTMRSLLLAYRTRPLSRVMSLTLGEVQF